LQPTLAGPRRSGPATCRATAVLSLLPRSTAGCCGGPADAPRPAAAAARRLTDGLLLVGLAVREARGLAGLTAEEAPQVGTLKTWAREGTKIQGCSGTVVAGPGVPRTLLQPRCPRAQRDGKLADSPMRARREVQGPSKSPEIGPTCLCPAPFSAVWHCSRSQEGLETRCVALQRGRGSRGGGLQP
jgi:hypothetical protein